MKKIIALLLIGLIVIFTGCTVSTVAKPDSLSLLEEDDNYRLYGYTDQNDTLTDYFYLIFNNDGERIGNGTHFRIEPQFKKFDNDVLSVYRSYGTNAGSTIYYNLSNSLVSDEYQNVFYENGELVVFVYYVEGETGTHIAAKNIFDTELLLDDELDMGGIMSTDFKVSVDGKTVTIEHAKGEKHETIVETFELE